MYQYQWDPETGGLLLTSDHSEFSKEPRPVYYRELDILGFDRFWTYPKDDLAPIMWAEANNYIYRGRLIAKTRGGSLNSAPELIVQGEPFSEKCLDYIDVQAMLHRNQNLLETLVQGTIQKIYNTYRQFHDKVDIFYVAYSGGKDSEVVLDLVQRALPHNEFVTMFGDTQMEFPDTYEIIKETELRCKELDIRFLTAKSELSPLKTWREFGPPAQTLRWCCSVHKTTPQILLLRKILGKPSFRGMAFTGIRGDESLSRSQYDDVSFGEKHKGQYSCHPLLEWSSAEIFLYIYANRIPLNETYKKGNSRAGCLVCPLAALKNFYFKEVSYANSEVDEAYTTTRYKNIIIDTTSKVFTTKKDQEVFMDMCGWKARKSGRELNFTEDYSLERQEGTVLSVTLRRERTSWREWIKTLGDLVEITHNHVVVQYHTKRYEIKLLKTSKRELKFIVDLGSNTKEDIYFASALKTVLRKSAYCIGCQVCEANCPNGAIQMKDGIVRINDQCVKCQKCHDVFHGCLVANSLRLPKEVSKMGSIDRYSNMGVEFDWVVDYFEAVAEDMSKADPNEEDDFKKEDSFWGHNGLGSKKIINLRSFLEDAETTKGKKVTDFGKTIARIGIRTPAAWGLLISNLAYTSEFNWWILHTQIGHVYTPDELMSMLGDGMTENSRKHVVSAYKNIFISNELLGRGLGLGVCDYELKNGKRYLNFIFRTTWKEPILEVVLYSLYKFAEACGGYYRFTLDTLIDDTIVRDGISPTRIFGLDKKAMVPILNGLMVRYPDFISASFTFNLNNITLRSDKTSADVLGLF